MKVQFTPQAKKDYSVLSPAIKRQADKQFNYLAKDIRHPSLQAKKYDEANDIWQARINKSWRFYFFIAGDTYWILRIVNHPK
ncbi:MAG TPA: hypothetical protein VJL57_00860 [Candidatus Paceibacterota bacterium]